MAQAFDQSQDQPISIELKQQLQKRQRMLQLFAKFLPFQQTHFLEDLIRPTHSGQ